jgi:hypothetical protein
MKKLTVCTVPLIVALSLISSSAADLNQGLVHHWSFDGNANDSVGGSHGTPVGAVLAPDRFGSLNSAFFFNGTDARIGLPDTTLSAGLAQGTLAAWVRVDSFDAMFGRVIFNRGIAASSTSLELGVGGNGELDANLSDQTPPSSLGQVSLGQWACVAMTWDGSSLSYYIDGNPSGTFSFTGTASDPFAGTRRVDIGVDDQNVGWFQGGIDDLRIYDRVLSGSDIQALCVVPEPSTVVFAVVGALALFGRCAFRRFRRG